MRGERRRGAGCGHRVRLRCESLRGVVRKADEKSCDEFRPEARKLSSEADLRLDVDNCVVCSVRVHTRSTTRYSSRRRTAGAKLPHSRRFGPSRTRRMEAPLAALMCTRDSTRSIQVPIRNYGLVSNNFFYFFFFNSNKRFELFSDTYSNPNTNT